MAKVIPQKVSEAKVSYVLYPFDRATTSKEGLHSPLKEVKKNSARERPMEREKVAEVLLDFMEWNKAEFRTTLSISCFHRKKEFRR